MFFQGPWLACCPWIRRPLRNPSTNGGNRSHNRSSSRNLTPRSWRRREDIWCLPTTTAALEELLIELRPIGEYWDSVTAGNSILRHISTCMYVGMFFLFYLCVGASIFSAIEGPLEKETIQEVIDLKKRFIESHGIDGTLIGFLPFLTRETCFVQRTPWSPSWKPSCRPTIAAWRSSRTAPPSLPGASGRASSSPAPSSPRSASTKVELSKTSQCIFDEDDDAKVTFDT